VAQRHPDPPVPLTGPAPLARTGRDAPDPAAGDSAGAALTAHLAAQATAFLRALRLRSQDERAAAAALCAAARRIEAALQTFEPLVDPVWAGALRTELAWLREVLCREHRHAARLARLTGALHRLTSDRDAAAGTMTVGAARAGALLERQLTLARTRAHSACLQAFGSARCHAIADAVALLTSEIPLTPAARAPAARALPPLARQAYRGLADAAGLLPLPACGHPYNGRALHATLADPADPDAPGDPQDLPWHRVRILARTFRYALEVGDADPASGAPDAARLYDAGRTLERHREAADAATAAATAARTPRITPATAYALGVLHADQRTEVEAARYAFGRLWQPAVPATSS
jgi:CHAD domain